MDLQIMLTVANLIGIPIGIFRSWYYVGVLKIRAMFENCALGVLEDDELADTMAIIHAQQSPTQKQRILSLRRKTTLITKSLSKDTRNYRYEQLRSCLKMTASFFMVQA